MADQFENTQPIIDKLQHADGSVTNLAGTIIYEAPNAEGAAQFAAAEPIPDKVLVSGGGTCTIADALGENSSSGGDGGSGGAAAWGAILGNLSDQTDLVGELGKYATIAQLDGKLQKPSANLVAMSTIQSSANASSLKYNFGLSMLSKDTGVVSYPDSALMTIGLATTSNAGLISPDEKTKLNAALTSIPAATSAAYGGVKVSFDSASATLSIAV